MLISVDVPSLFNNTGNMNIYNGSCIKYLNTSVNAALGECQMYTVIIICMYYIVNASLQNNLNGLIYL